MVHEIHHVTGFEKRLDAEVNTLVWPNGADFDPAILHDWPDYGPEMTRLANTWEAPPGAVIC